MKGWSKAAREQKEKRERGSEEIDIEKPGVCPCGNNHYFKLRFLDHKLIRTCRECGQEKIV